MYIVTIKSTGQVINVETDKEVYKVLIGIRKDFNLEDVLIRQFGSSNTEAVKLWPRKRDKKMTS